jgi:predicted ATPase/DNA-binding NarL/FixJ family response regulator
MALLYVDRRAVVGGFTPGIHEAAAGSQLVDGSPAGSRMRAGLGGRLPAELGSFVGRRHELAGVTRLLGQSRLVTLTGLGGVGKTRLGLQAAGQLRRGFADRVWFIDLAALRDPVLLNQETEDPELLAHLMAVDLGLREDSTGSPLELLTDYLAPCSALLLLDNCEHVLPACAVLAEALLRSCSGLRILATSREPLKLAGETIFVVPPLPVPVSDRSPALAELVRSEAVALFVARGETALPAFRLTVENRAAVAGICRELDGVPFALELAASRLPVLAPQQILDRLADRFALLSRGPRSAPDRQHTLRACVDWSYDLCSKPERLLWERLSVFVGGCDLDAIEGVCVDEQLPAGELLEVLAGLVDKSILVREDDGEGVRYRMLATLREYAREALIESGELDAVRRRHRDWYRQLVEQARAGWISERQRYWLARMRREHSNVRAAIEYCLTAPGEAEAALDIVVGLPLPYWYGRDVFAEGRGWLNLALGQAPAPTAVRARGLMRFSELVLAQGDVETGTRLLEQGERLAVELDDATALAHAAHTRGLAAMYAGQPRATVQILEQARRMVSAASDADHQLRPQLLLGLGAAAGVAGDHERAVACAREVLAITEPTGEAVWRSHAVWILGFVAWRRGNLGEAIGYGRRCLQLNREMGSEDRFGTALGLELLAWITADRHQYRRAATLLGATDALLVEVGTSLSSLHHLIGFHDGCEQQTRAALGDAAFQDPFAHGRSLTDEDALAYALEESRPAPASRAPGVAKLLTRRERDVAEHVGRGLSNKEVAARLVISQRTAEGHVQKILTKFGFTSRAQIAAWIVAEQSAV